MLGVLSFLRRVKDVLNKFSTLEVAGIPLDWLLHLLGGAAIVFILSRFLSLRRAFWIGIGMLALKEVVDVFAKTRVEYIRAPGLDLAVDIMSGLVGILIGLVLACRFPRRGS